MTLKDILPGSRWKSRIKRFPLLRRLSMVSLLAMLAAASLLIISYWQDQVAEHEAIAASANLKTLNYLNRSLGGRIEELVRGSEKPGQPDPRAIRDFESELDSSLAAIGESDVLKLKIYNRSGVVVYSSAKGEVGGGSVHPEWLARALRGETLHGMERRDTFFGRAGELKGIDVAMTYMPLLDGGSQIGVIEIYDDASKLFDRFYANAVKIALVVFGAFGYLFAALYYAIYRTDRAVAEWQDAVVKGEECLRRAQHIGRLGSYVLDMSSGSLESSDMLDELLGITGEYDHSVKGWFALIHPADKEKVTRYFREEVVGKGRAFNKEYRIIRHNDHAERWVHGLGKLEFDEKGHPRTLHGTVQDITERKLAEQELRIAAAAFDTQDAIVITDVNANIVRVNQAFTEVSGYAADEVIGKNPRLMHSGRHDRDFYVKMWQELLHSGRWSGEIYDRRKSGEVYPKWMTITAIRNEEQETTHYVSISSDITARKRIEEEIHNLAFYDTLTRLPNRRLFLDRLQAALAASARHDDYGAILFIDLDRFKALNDSLGHEYGDMLLVEVGGRIKSCVREMDTVARFGGDEFVVLINSVSRERDDATRKVSLVAEKIRDALACPYKLKAHEHHCSPSIGISLYHGGDEPLDALIEHADMAMYQVKNSGRNGVRFFDPVMQHNVATHDMLENDLHYAIELRQLQLHYQIQVDREKRPLGAEAFLRWLHPERGMIMPSQFLPIAEESGLAVDIGKWVLQMACHQLVTWGRDDATKNLTLTVNVSARHFSQPGFVDEVGGVLRASGADPTRLKLELSERLVLADIHSTMDKISALKRLGVRLSMDNFGTVYSSLNYLKQLSSDQLKIHQEFVRGITDEGRDAQLVQKVIDLARSMDMDVFAEGVETEEQKAFLERLDCNGYQGYLFGKPVSAEEFEALIRQL